MLHAEPENVIESSLLAFRIVKDWSFREQDSLGIQENYSPAVQNDSKPLSLWATAEVSLLRDHGAVYHGKFLKFKKRIEKRRLTYVISDLCKACS